MPNHPNRGPKGPSANPAPAEVRAAREAAGLSQTAAAAPDKAFSFLVLGAWFAVQSALFLAVLVGITGLLRQRARSSIFGSASAGRWLQGLGGLLFLGLAARLARTEAPVP